MENQLLLACSWIRGFRDSLRSRSKTANAIDRHDSWDRIAHFAAEEGHMLFAQQLLKYHEQFLKGQLRAPI